MISCCSKVDNTAEKKAPEPEPTFQLLTNPARVIPAQEKFIRFIEGSRYVPVKPAPSGFILLRDLQPTEAEDLALTDAPSTVAATTGNTAAAAGQQGSGSTTMAVDEEPQPPQPFEYTS
jgi:26S proteasome regulatory subunit N2